jgi:GMP synthase (glutamine-hydrolysing)
MLLIIDNQSDYIKKFIGSFLSKQDFGYILFDHNQPIVLSVKMEISGVILSGGRGNPFEPLNLTSNFVALINFAVPILGFCLGHEIIAVAYRGRLKKLPGLFMNKERITITKTGDPIFEGLISNELHLKRKHHFHVSELPSNFESLAESDITPNEIIKHKEKPIYGFQAHPEVSGAEGLLIIKNFLKMCGLA